MIARTACSRYAKGIPRVQHRGYFLLETASIPFSPKHFLAEEERSKIKYRPHNRPGALSTSYLFSSSKAVMECDFGAILFDTSLVILHDKATLLVQPHLSSRQAVR